MAEVLNTQPARAFVWPAMLFGDFERITVTFRLFSLFIGV